jgi:hypothetical protein
MLWKRTLIRKNPENPSGNIFSILKKQVKHIRSDGEGPERDHESFSRYVCDLCHSTGPLSGLRQCVICGRWGCSECWIEEYYLCRSCGGIMRMLMMNIDKIDKKEDCLKDSDNSEPISEESS